MFDHVKLYFENLNQNCFLEHFQLNSDLIVEKFPQASNVDRQSEQAAQGQENLRELKQWNRKFQCLQIRSNLSLNHATRSIHCSELEIWIVDDNRIDYELTFERFFPDE